MTFILPEPQFPHVRNGGDNSHILKPSCRLYGLKFASVLSAISDLEEALSKFQDPILLFEVFMIWMVLNELLSVSA